MKDLKLLVWLTQLGLSVALPPAVLIYGTVWLRDNRGWGSWVIWVGIILGVLLAFDTLRTGLKLLQNMTKSKQEEPPPVRFNDRD